MGADTSPRHEYAPRARQSARRSLGLFRRVRREGHGLRLAVPPEVAELLGLGEGAHVYFALGDGGTVQLVNASSLTAPGAALVAESESRAALLIENRRLRRKLAARRQLTSAWAYHAGRMDEARRWAPLPPWLPPERRYSNSVAWAAGTAVPTARQ